MSKKNDSKWLTQVSAFQNNTFITDNFAVLQTKKLIILEFMRHCL